jgi:hypothetical protein
MFLPFQAILSLLILYLGTPIVSLVYFCLAKLRLHTKNLLCIMLGSESFVWVGGGVESEFSDRFG